MKDNSLATPAGRRWLRPLLLWGGRLVALAALALFAVALWHQWPHIRDWNATPARIAALLGLGVTYGLMLLLYAEVWHQLTIGMARSALPRRLTISSSAMSQIAKYLPGNVMHFVGRHMLLVQGGMVTQKQAAIAGVTEIALAAACAALFAGLGVLAFGAPAGFAYAFPAALAVVLGAALVSAAIVPLRRNWGAVDRILPATRSLFLAGALLLLFFALQALLFLAVLALAGGTPESGMMPMVTLAWLAGFVVPGAPGGLGSREYVLSTLLAPATGPAVALLATLLFRLVTTLGDLVVSLLGYWISRRG